MALARMPSAALGEASFMTRYHSSCPLPPQSVMSTTTPIEVWEGILRYAIAVPLFFDTDPITNYGMEHLPRYCFQAEYWEAERVRNALRQVCRSWDRFLKPYDNRYVRLSDIYNGFIPMTAISEAIRLTIDPDIFVDGDIQGIFSGMSGLLRSYIAPGTRTNQKRHVVKEWLRSRIAPRNEGTNLAKELRVEILEGVSVMNPVLLHSWLETLPHLRAILDPPTPSHLQQVRPNVPGLRFLYTNPAWASMTTAGLSLDHLTTLHLEQFSIDISLKNWRLPALQHLSIEAFTEPISAEGFGDKMLEIVETLGTNLITLHYQGIIASCSLPDIWVHIPHVERIQIPYWTGTSAPANHPAHIVTIPVEPLGKFMARGASKPADSIFNYLPHPTQFLAKNLVIKMDVTWFSALLHSPLTRGGTTLVNLTLWLARYYEADGVKFTDVEGVILDDYLVFVVRSFWKGSRGSRLRKTKRYAITLKF